jgi:uncharacterized protein (TIGR02118 family)
MIKVSVMYPNSPGARFDHAYYRDTHMPMLAERLGETCRHYSIDKGLAGAETGSMPAYIAMCHLYCDTVEAFNAQFGKHAREIMRDVGNYTDLKPMMQFSEVVLR